jgi:hypothetical protein
MLKGYANREPDYINAGDSVMFERSLPAYPASQGWALHYTIIGLGAQVSFVSTADGDSHAILVPAATTALWLPADGAILAGEVVNANTGEAHQIYYLSCPVRPNLQNAPPDQPALTFIQKVILALEELYLQKSTDDLLVAQVGDSRFQYESKSEVFDALCKARAHRRVEVAKQRARMGKPSARRILPVLSITPPGPLFGQQWPGGYIGGS